MHQDAWMDKGARVSQIMLLVSLSVFLVFAGRGWITILWGGTKRRKTS